jgi:hypothetical protein
MPQRFEDRVAVASGTATEVAGWASLLRAENIRYIIATSTQPDTKNSPNHVELWVPKKDADKARKILQATTEGDGPFLW